MPLSNLTDAFKESVKNVEKEKQNIESNHDTPSVGPGFVPSFIPHGQDIPNNLKPNENVLNSNELLEIIRRDVDFNYNSETKAINISSGELTPNTMDAIKAYIDAIGKESENMAYATILDNELNITIGEDVTFKTHVEPVLGGFEEVSPSFRGIKCNSIDIRSHNIINGDKMFYGTDVNTIKIADQPNMKSAVNMFTGCGARAIVLGEIPDDCRGASYGNTIESINECMFSDCNSIVMDSTLTNIIHDPTVLSTTAKDFTIRDSNGKDLKVMDNGIVSKDVRDYVNEVFNKHKGKEVEMREELNEKVDKILENSNFKNESDHEKLFEENPNYKSAHDRAREAAEAFGIDAFSGDNSTEKSNENDFGN